MNKQERQIKVQQAIEMYYSQKMTAAQIASTLGVVRTTVQRWLKSHNQEQYINFVSGSKKSNKKHHISESEQKNLAEKFIKKYSASEALKNIAKEAECSVAYVSLLMRKFCPEELDKIKLKKKEASKTHAEQRKQRRRIERDEEIASSARMREQQASAAKELSFRAGLSNYIMFLIHRYLYQRTQPGIYELKRSQRISMPADMPKRYISHIERECYRAS